MPTDADRSKQAQLLATVPLLRPMARSLAADPASVDDLLQETFLQAWVSLDRFEHGTSMIAWLRIILRNLSYSEYRKRRREVLDGDGIHSAELISPPAQEPHLDLLDLQRAMARLAPAQREALILVGAEGVAYETAAAICDVGLGTMKSRIHRARTRLSELLDDARSAPARTADPHGFANTPCGLVAAGD